MQLHICDIEKPIVYNKSAIWGKIFIQINDSYFPDTQWWDAVSSILDMWIVELIEYIHNKSPECCLYFMDGPFMVKLSNINNSGYVLVSCKKESETILSNTTVPLSAFIDGVLTATNKFLDICNNESPNFIGSEIFLGIKKAYEELKAARRDMGQKSNRNP